MGDFTLKLLLSFLVGGSYIAFTIQVSEKLGSKIGGLIIGLPSTTLVSVAFIGWTHGAAVAVSAVPIMPVAMAAGALFSALFVRLNRFGAAAAFASALLAWAAITFPLVASGIDSILLSLLIAAILLAAAIWLVSGFPHQKLPSFAFSRREFLFRSAFAGCIVALSVFLAKAAGPLWGGIFACFPAAFSSSLLLITKKHGISFASSVARTMPYGTMANVSFAVSFFLLAPALGLEMGILLAYAVAAASAALIYNNPCPKPTHVRRG